MKEAQDEKSNTCDILIVFNNHFAGFGPPSINDFLDLLNLPELDWKSELNNYKDNLTFNLRMLINQFYLIVLNRTIFDIH
ncbi:hypothetical protein YTPLAS21_06400 [Candidatus Nitrosocosmicus sp.]|nr:hypothetical protein YTPLAS21_06400 [Candidatus Nitrosocosmicus sp.]